MADHPDNANPPLSNRPETILGVTITCLIIACTAVSLRLWVRFKERLWGYDDLFVLLAALSIAIGSIITCFMPDDGMGKHYWTLSRESKVQYFKHVWSTNLTYSIGTTFIKLAILCQYLRLFDFQSRIARIITWVLIVVTSLWGVAFVALGLFSCRPIKKNWEWTVPGTCVAWGSKSPDTFFPSWAAHSATNMLLDILVLVLPIPFLRNLRLQGKTRLGLIGLFVVGGTVVTMSVSRMIALCLKRAGTVPVPDMTYATPSIYIFSILEVNIAILCASIPIFWPLVTSLAANKILVVNEVEVRTSRRDSQNIGLAEQGAHSGFTGLRDIELDSDLDTKPRSSRLSVLMSSKETKYTSKPPRRSTSHRHHAHAHTPKKPSTSSSKHSITTPSLSLDLGHRLSHESQQNLALAHKSSTGGFSSSNTSSLSSPSPTSNTMTTNNNNPITIPDPARNGSVTHYQDRYVQDWVVPDFEKSGTGLGLAGGGGHSNGGAAQGLGPGSGVTGNTTTVERAAVPFDHIRSLEK